MVSASYHVQPGRCAVGKHEDEYAGARELFVLELHWGEPPALRRTRSTDEIGICLEHWRDVVQGITLAVIGLVAEEDPAIGRELARQAAEQFQGPADPGEGELAVEDVAGEKIRIPLEPARPPEKPFRIPRRRRGTPMQ